MAIYATRDYECTGPDFGRIRENAEIKAFSTREAAEAWLTTNPEVVGFDFSTEYGDAWIKSTRAPRDPDDFMVAPFTSSELFVQGPGEHPGGRFWWITPTVPVLVVTNVRIREA